MRIAFKKTETLVQHLPFSVAVEKLHVSRLIPPPPTHPGEPRGGVCVCVSPGQRVHRGERGGLRFAFSLSRCLALSILLSATRTQTHTNTHTQTLSPPPPSPFCLSFLRLFFLRSFPTPLSLTSSCVLYSEGI